MMIIRVIVMIIIIIMMVIIMITMVIIRMEFSTMVVPWYHPGIPSIARHA